MAPLARALAARRRLSHQLVLSGQHPGLGGHFDSSIDLVELAYDPRGRTSVKLRESLHRLLCGRFQSHRPDLVLVHGDTASALAGALAARDCRIAVGHVEAGLRSFDLKHPWPEEGNRMAIDALSALLFAPTDRSAENLRRDWRVKGEIHVTGNTGIDALLEQARRIGAVPPSPRPVVLVTCHRKENQGEASRAICEALRRMAQELDVEVVLPLHTNPQVRAAIEGQLAGIAGIRLLEPLGYEEMVRWMIRCTLLLTDSGGLQEEGPALGKPVLVMRDVTERPEAVECGSVELVGTRPERIVGAVASLLSDADKLERMSRPRFPFGDGCAAPRIAAAVEDWLTRRSRRRA